MPRLSSFPSRLARKSARVHARGNDVISREICSVSFDHVVKFGIVTMRRDASINGAGGGPRPYNQPHHGVMVETNGASPKIG